MSRYEGVLSLTDRVHGWIEGTRAGASIRNVRTVTPQNLNEHMEFDCVIFSFGDHRIADVVGIWAPTYHQLQDEHGDWLEPEAERSDSPWHLMHGYTGQHGYRGPWMHESEYIGARMAEDILRTAGIYVAVHPSILGNEGEEIAPDTWAVAYISENIPGSVP